MSCVWSAFLDWTSSGTFDITKGEAVGLTRTIRNYPEFCFAKYSFSTCLVRCQLFSVLTRKTYSFSHSSSRKSNGCLNSRGITYTCLSFFFIWNYANVINFLAHDACISTTHVSSEMVEANYRKYKICIKNEECIYIKIKTKRTKKAGQGIRAFHDKIYSLIFWDIF